MRELEGDAHARERLVGVRAAALVRIQHGEGGRRSLVLVRQVMVCHDNVERVGARPFERLVRAYAAVNADDERVAFQLRAFENVAAYAVALGETVRHVVARRRAEDFERAPEDDRARRAVNVVVAVNQNALARLDRAQYARDRLAHAEHQVRVV